MILPIARNIRRTNKLSRLAPNPDLPARRPHNILLIIRPPKNHIPSQPHNQDPNHLRSRQIDRISRQILRLNSVKTRHDNHRPEAEIVPEMIMRHIDRAEIPALVPEEIKHVDEMEQINQPHRIRHPSQPLILIRRMADRNQRPRNNPRAAIMKELEIPQLAKARVQLYPDKVVEDEGAAEFAIVRVGGGKMCLRLCEEGEGEPVDGSGNQ